MICISMNGATPFDVASSCRAEGRTKTQDWRAGIATSLFRRKVWRCNYMQKKACLYGFCHLWTPCVWPTMPRGEL